MKRLILWALMLALLMTVPVTVAAQDVKNSDGDYYDHEETGVTIPYRLILPESYDEKYSFPMVVFFHGAGERGYDNERQLSNCVQQIADNMPKAIILVPQCTHDGQWVDTPWSDGGYSVDAIPESDELMAVMALVKQVMQDYSVDKNMVYAAGISMGGYAVWDVMVRHNDVFAAGIAVCGAGDPSKAEFLKDTPMFVFHGAQDGTVPVSGSFDMVAAIQKAGGTKVQYTEYPDGGHGIWGQVFNLETLYKDLQKCKLSDRYTLETQQPEENGTAQQPVTDILPYLIFGGIGVLVVSFVVILVAGGKKDSKENTQQTT